MRINPDSPICNCPLCNFVYDEDDADPIDLMADAYADEEALREALARGEVDAHDPEQIARDYEEVICE